MVHTATLTYNAKYDKYKKFIETKGVVFHREKSNSNIGKYVYDKLRNYGIIIRAYRLKGLGYYRFSMKINFKRMIQQDTLYHKHYNRVEILELKDISLIENKFNELMYSIGTFMPEFNSWKTNRIDYCINIKTPYVKEYIDLLQKGDKTTKYQKYPLDRNNNRTLKPGSLYLVTNSTTVNFYDKQDQLKKEQANNIMITDDMINQAKDILRLEIQCKKPKTETIKIKLHKQDISITTKSINNFLDLELSREIIEYYLLRIAKKGDYLRVSKALEKIDKQPKHKKTKELLKKIIKDCAKQYQSIWKVRKYYIENEIMDNTKFSCLIRMLKDININPITISDNRAIQGLKLNQGLDNIWSLFDKSFKEQIDNLDNMLYDAELEIDDFEEYELVEKE